MATGPWDPHAAAIGRLRASDADRDRVVDALKAAYVAGLAHHGRARRADEPGARGADLRGPDRGQRGAGRTPGTAVVHPPARTRVSKKAVAYGTSAIVLVPALVAAFLTFYGGFIILFLVACVGVVVSAGPMAPRRPGALPSAGRR